MWDYVNRGMPINKEGTLTPDEVYSLVAFLLYRNGVINLVKPHVFPATRRAETQAATLAVNGDLIRKHPIDGERHQLIVVSTHSSAMGRPLRFCRLLRGR